MDLQALSNLFATTLSPDPNVRKAGELEIRKIGGQEGLVSALLQIISNNQVDLATRQACSVYLKNRVHTSYTLDIASRRPDTSVIPPSDRDALKSHILTLLSASPSRAITVQLASTFKDVVAHDFPDRWPGLLDEVKAMLGSGDIGRVGAGCVASLECVRAFRYRQQPEHLSRIVEALLPTLVSIGTQMVQTPPTQAQEIPMMLHLILKTYRTSIIVSLSRHQQSPESIVPWGRLLFATVNLQLPKEAVPEDEEERERAEWWKAKKWAFSVLTRLFHRYGNPSQLPTAMKKEYGAFADHFCSSFAPEILTAFLHQVELFVSGQAWLSRKSQYHIFSFFSECVKPKSTWALLKPHFQTLVTTFVFPQLCFNSTKQSMWDEDPVDYVRASVDEYENFATPVSAATSFLFSLASNRTKVTFMPILAFVNTVLQSNPSPAHRFGVLNMTAALGPFIMRHPEVKGQMEQFVMQHVTPQFDAPEAYLRAICCEVVGTLVKCGISWSSESNLHTNFTAVIKCLDDVELPVRVQAILALTELLVVNEPVKIAVGPMIGKIIQDLIKLADETDLDLLNHSMEVMVELFQDELLPVAAQLTARLCESYIRLAKESMVQNEQDIVTDDVEAIVNSEDDDKTFVAMGMAKTIATIVSSIDSSPEILGQVQEVVIPIIVFTLEHKLLDLFDNMYDLIDSLTFKTRSISPNMWPVFEQTYKLYKSDAVDFLEEMLPSLDNFVSYGTDVFKAREDYRRMAVDIYTSSMVNPHLGENDRVNGCKLAESILLNLRGHVDDALEAILTTSLDHLGKSETSHLRLANLEVLVNAVLYNPHAALHLMENTRPGMSRTFFDGWFEAIRGERTLPRVHDKRLSIIALCALLEMDPEQVPSVLQDGWPTIVGGILHIFKDLPKAIADRKALQDSLEEEDSDEDSDDSKYLNFDDDEGDVQDQETAYLEMLAQENFRLRAQSNKPATVEDIDEEEDDDDDDDEIEEELGYISPLDSVNPYTTFKQALTTFQMKNPAMYASATTSLNQDQAALLMEVMRIAENPVWTHEIEL